MTTDQKMDTETFITKKDLEALQISTDNIVSPTDLASINLVYQNDQIIIESESQKGEFQEQAITKPLKVRVKPYSTRKYNKHHVEEVKVDFYSEVSSSSDEDGATTE